MNIVLQHMQNILRQSKTPLWNGYVNMLKTLESVFLSPKHWVLEFLQNAEDAFAKKFVIHLGQDSLQIFNDVNAFSNDDFYAICDVNSRKLPSLGFRGYIGIGFKSIFRITDCITIHSGDFHFKFDKKYWDDSKRKGISIPKWPWEILPIETNSVELKEDYTTGFFIPLESVRGQKILEEIEKFLAGYDFPKEAILLLKNIEIIEIQIPQSSYTITKEKMETEDLPIGEKELVLVRKQVIGQQYPEEFYYLVFRKIVNVPDDIRQDEETERVRRSEITEREIGLVFGLDSEKNPQALYGKLAGVYSFLPVEGEQTGLPFGIFGDFIPQPGRDLINYGAKWNHWMCNEVATFFKQLVRETFSSHPQWMFFPSELLEQFTLVSGPGKAFWENGLRYPIKEFLKSEALYPDDDGDLYKLNELATVNDAVVQVIGKDLLKKTLVDKKIVHHSIKSKIQSGIGSNIDIYELLHRRELLESLKNQPEKLARCYCLLSALTNYYLKGRQGRDAPLSQIPFVLAEDGEFYPPDKMVLLEIDMADVPNFLIEFIPEDKKLVHPEIAKDADAIRQLERCDLMVASKQNVIRRLEQLLSNATSPKGVPQSWKYPDDLIEATLFLSSEPYTSYRTLTKLVAQDGSLHAVQNLFTPRAPLDWTSLWSDGLLPGFQPLHKKYFDKSLWQRYGLQQDHIINFLHNLCVHGFEANNDKGLIEKAATEKAKRELTDKGHILAPVEDRKRLGYDFQCQGHCEKVFEVKGMTTSHDVTLPESEVIAAQQKKDNYILICVYNLPTQSDRIGYKEIPNPEKIWQPVEKARIPKDKWLRM